MAAGNRKDGAGRKLETGEYYDSVNKRYMYRKMVDGERVTVTASTLKELRVKKHEIETNIDKGVRPKANNTKMTLNDYIDHWFDTYAKSGRKATTCQNYASYHQTYIKDSIGKKRINKITKADCQKIFNNLMEKGLKQSTMANLKSFLNSVFECAIDDDIIVKNPVKNIRLPKTDNKKKEAVDQEDVEIFMEFVKNNEQYSYSYPSFVVMFNLGVRIGEMAAITWDSVDFENNTITIDKQINRYRKEDYGFTRGVASPKTKTSVRCIPMNSVVRSTLLELKMKYQESDYRLPFVDDRGVVRGYVTGFIFVNSMGTTWCEPCFRNLIIRIVKDINKEADKNNTKHIKNFCPHMTRHTYTSIAYSAGADVKAVSEVLGHASTAVTMDTYTHLTKEKKEEQDKVLKNIKIS